jgi:hypothetical protein
MAATATTLKVGDSVPAVSDRLALFALPPTEAGIEKRYNVNYRPVSQLVDASSPLEFAFTGAIDMIDLRNTELHVRAKIVNGKGENVSQDECVAPSNLLLHSLFEKVDITIGGKMMTHAMGGYPYMSYLRTIRCLGADNNHLESVGFKLDSGDMDATGLMPKKDPSDKTEKRVFNGGALHRALWFTDGKTFEMQGRLLADVCDLSRFLLNNTEVAVKLYRSRPEFMLGAKDATAGYKILLEEIYLKVAYVKPSPGVLMGLSRALDQKHKALYPFTRSEVRTFNIPEAYQDIYLDNIFQDVVPSVIMVGLLDSRAKNGSFLKNCFNFQPYDVREIGISVDGAYVPGLPQKVNFSKGQNYVTAYKNFMSCLRGHADDVGIGLDQFKDGFTLFTFSLESEAGGDDPEKNLSLAKHGSVRLEVLFGKALPHTVSILVYCEYPSLFTIDKARRVELM